jgi:beta-galactosidase
MRVVIFASLMATTSPSWASAPSITAFNSTWRVFGRASISQGEQSVNLSNGSIARMEPVQNFELSFRAKGVGKDDPVQIWGAIGVKDRENRYVFGLRGGVEPQLSFARYASDGASRNLGCVPLEFTPRSDEWYRLRVHAVGRHFHIYLNDEPLPRVNFQDDQNGWNDGGVALGGGWLETEFKDFKIRKLEDEEIKKFQAIGTKTFSMPQPSKEATRSNQRESFKPVRIESLPKIRGEYSLDGSWLFMPDDASDLANAGPDLDDKGWHIMQVPALWTFSYCWLYGEDGFQYLKGAAAYRSPSDKATQEELDRLDALTFNWRKTKAAWYRKVIELPESLDGRHFRLVFGGIAKIADIWVNEKKIASNTGMFGEIDCDITGAVKPGKNIVAVYVRANLEREIDNAKKEAAEAVTVKVTNDMINALPRGMMQFNAAGIWQPAKLVVSSPATVGEVFVKTGLDQAKAEVEIINHSEQPLSGNISVEIHDAKDGSLLCTTKSASVNIPAHGKTNLEIATPKVSPKLWTPQTPNLYNFTLNLKDDERTIDTKQIRIGFRTFEIDGNRFLLNGKPYWLRGANMPPSVLRPNDGTLARKFFELSRQGNVWATRSHCQPFTKAWLDAADEVGMAVSLEGTWPWLMIKGEPPSPELLKIWKDEFIGLMRRYRNHPSVLIWTVNNEMNFSKFDEKDIPLLTRKWKILDDAIREMRKTDPTRPISCYSGYVRKYSEKGYNDVVHQNGFDDGDIDDIHTYNGWYNSSFFTFYNGEFAKRYGTIGRPLISQEISTGYPRNDGWASRSYIYNRYVAQALVGNYAFEQSDPAIFMKRQGLLTKELTETIRRTSREMCAGLMPFSYLTWFENVWKSDSIRPRPTYFEVAKSMQPVLVSAELFGRHFYAGDKLTRRVCVINDSEDSQAAPAGKLIWEIRDGDVILAKGESPVPSVNFYSNHWLNVDFQMPAQIPSPRVDAKLVLALEVGGQVLSTNDYDIVLATKEWAAVQTSQAVPVFDPTGKAKATLAGIATKAVSLDNLAGEKSLVVGDLDAVLKTPNGSEILQNFVRNGGKLLLLQPASELLKFLPKHIKSHRTTQGEIVNMVIPESPVFDGLEPLDLAWFEQGQRKTPIACTGTWEVNRENSEVTPIAHQCDFHTEILFGPEIQKPFFKVAGAPIVEISMGNGKILASEMTLSAKDKDPIAGKLLRNMIEFIK